ncbi:MAG: hypothetical protein M3R57_06825 [Chloroflexota bacterium]|nr:hypothetical protein [Chloroflexota bacterium]
MLQLRPTLMSAGTDAGDNVLQGRGGVSVGFTWTAHSGLTAGNAALHAAWVAPSMQTMQSIVCPVCGFIAETTDASRLRTVWADHLLGGCGDDVAAITTAMESCIEQRQELWRSGMTDEVFSLTVTIDLLWEALRYARLAEPPVAAT